MKITRRFAVTSLLFIAVAVVLGAPAPASAARDKTTSSVRLYPTADSPSPHAIATVTSLYPNGMFYTMVNVSVSKLAPNASYYMPVAWRYRDYWGVWHDQVYNVPIQTDARGNGGGGFYARNGFIMNPGYQVYDSSGTLVLTPNP